MKAPEVVVEVCNGIAQVTRKPKGVRVKIVDHDNRKEDMPWLFEFPEDREWKIPHPDTKRDKGEG